MKIREYFNTTKENVEAKKYNIFIPICLGNKFFTYKNVLTGNVREYSNWALENTKDKILFLIVDKIQDTNHYVRNKNSSEEGSIRRVLKDGEEIKHNLERLISIYPQNEQDKIKIIRWEEYEKNDPFCMKTTSLVYKEFKNNKDFRERILNIVKTSVTDREFSEEKYWRLCDYVLDEFSLCYSGLVYGGDIYDMFIYPARDSASDFILESVKKEEAFSKLNKKLPQQEIVLGVLR